MRFYKQLFRMFICASLAIGLVTGAGAQKLSREAVAFSPSGHDGGLKPQSWSDQLIRYTDQHVDADLVVALDQQQFPALRPLIKEFARARNIRIDVANGTCGISAGKLSSKRIDIGGYCCPPGQTDRLPGLAFYTLGIAAIALITHPDNPRADVSMAQARQLFSGEIQNWSALEPIVESDGPVQAVGRLHCKQRPGHWRLLLDHEDAFSPYLLEVGSIPDMIAQVSYSPFAIGFETLWMIKDFGQDLSVKTLKIDGVAPEDDAAVAAGRYPLYRTYSITVWTDGAANPLAGELVTWLQQKTVSLAPEYGLISAQRLRANGWQFNGDELVGEPAAPGKQGRDLVVVPPG